MVWFGDNQILSGVNKVRQLTPGARFEPLRVPAAAQPAAPAAAAPRSPQTPQPIIIDLGEPHV